MRTAGTDARSRALAVLLPLAAACGDDASGAGPGGSGGSGGGPETTAPSTASGEVAGSGAGDGSGGEGSAASSSSGGAGPASSSSAGGGAPVAEVHVVGRTIEEAPGSHRFAWSNTALRARIDGAGLDVFLDGAAGIWFEVAVDGESVGRFETAGGPGFVTAVSGLGPGQHTIEIVRRNEGFFGEAVFGEAVTDGMFVPTPARDRRLAFVGDSLTAGYGIEDADPCSFSGDTESSYAAYAAVAARELDADAHVIAFSGKGVIQNYGGDLVEPMPELWPRTLTGDPGQTWDPGGYQPAAWIVNLGTNDFSAPLDDGAFVDGYAAFLGEIRAAHPSAAIVCVTWAHWGASREALVAEAVAATGDGAISTTRFTIEGGEGLGCDGHTNVVTNARLGAELAATLRGLLGW
jgi:hypothetical protein